jgi:hypothetical protein
MITLNTSMCGATANFPEAVMATLGGQLVVFDYTPDQAGGSGPGAYCEGYLPRDPQYAGMYEIFGYMPDDWYFFDGNSFNWYNDCALINGVDGTAGFNIHGIAFQPESMPVVRAGSGCRPSGRAVERALSQVVMLAPDPHRSRSTSVVRLAVDRPILHHRMAARFNSVPPAPTGFGNPTLDNLQPNLVCVWKLEEGAGTRVDAVSGEDLSAHNAPGSAAGKNGLAGVFSNAAANGLYRDLAQLGPLGAHAADTEIAFSTWLYAYSVGYRSIAGFIDEMGGMGPWSLTVGYQNRAYLNISTYNWNDNAWAQTDGLSAGQWYNLVLTFSNTGHLRLYLNGSLVATNDTYSGTGGLAQSYSPFTLGCGQVYDYEHDTTGYGNSWDGLIDETCVWNAVPDDPDAFAAALWNGGRGAFYRIDTTRRTASGIAATARQPVDILRRERVAAAANLALTGSTARFDAVARLVHARPAVRPAARSRNGHRRAETLESIFGLNPSHAAFAHRAVARRLTGDGFGTPVVDALDSQLVCCWKMEEDTGKRIDAITGENLTPHQTPIRAPGVDGQACRFSNAQANGLYRDLADLGALGCHGPAVELTVSTWFYADSVGYRSIAGFIDEMGGMGPWSLTLGYQNRVYLNISTYNWNDNAWVQTDGLNAGQWYNLVFTFSNTGHLRLYLNGSLVATNDTYSGTGGLAQPYSPFTLGCGQVYDYEHDTTGYGNSWDGLIDETCVWNSVPANPDAFAAALWNGGQGMFYRIDTTRRGTFGMAVAARQTTGMPGRERFQALMEQTMTGTAVRLDAVAQLIRGSLAARTTARAIARHNRVDVFRSISGLNLNPVRTAVAHRAVVRRIALAAAATDARAAARQSTLAIGGGRLVALAETVLTGIASRFDAVAYRNYQVTGLRPHAGRFRLRLQLRSHPRRRRGAFCRPGDFRHRFRQSHPGRADGSLGLLLEARGTHGRTDRCDLGRTPDTPQRARQLPRQGRAGEPFLECPGQRPLPRPGRLGCPGPSRSRRRTHRFDLAPCRLARLPERSRLHRRDGRHGAVVCDGRLPEPALPERQHLQLERQRLGAERRTERRAVVSCLLHLQRQRPAPPVPERCARRHRQHLQRHRRPGPTVLVVHRRLRQCLRLRARHHRLRQLLGRPDR